MWTLFPGAPQVATTAGTEGLGKRVQVVEAQLPAHLGSRPPPVCELGWKIVCHCKALVD